MPETLREAWKDGIATGLSIATALSIKAGKTLPWKTVRDVISSALQARFIELATDSVPWPCDFPSAQFAKVKETAQDYRVLGEKGGSEVREDKVLVAEGELEPSQVQDLAEIMPKLLEIKARDKVPFQFGVRVKIGDGKTAPPTKSVKDANALLKKIKEGLELK
jgi:hypothetical protein